MPDEPASQSTAEPAPAAPAAAKPSFLRRWLKRLAITAVAFGVLGFVAAELFARFYLQLGDPPLFQAENDMRYRMVPNQVAHRLGNTITYNRFSMRGTPDLDDAKPANERRVCFVGDSVINGGAWVGDAQLATFAIQERLQAASKEAKVRTLNVSAGSWSPIQQLAYLRRFGLFKSDVVVFVFNYEDALDDGAPRALSSEQPTRKPLLAMEEVLFRYVPSALNYYVFGGRQQAAAATPATDPPVREEALNAIRQLVQLARANQARVAAVLHFSEPELTAGPRPGLAAIRQVLRELDTPIIETSEPFRQAARRGLVVYRDPIHPSMEGQAPLAEALYAAASSAR